MIFERRPSVRRACRLGRSLFSLAILVLPTLPVAAAAPWDDPFAAPAEAIAAAAAEVPAAEGGADVLFSERHVRFEDDGRQTVRYRLVYRVSRAEMVDGWSNVVESWSPWHQARPEVRARVIAAGGRELALDPATLSEQPVPTDDPSVFADRRLLHGPLPGIGVGAIVVEERVVRDTAPFFAAGAAGRHMFGHGVPVAEERLVLDVPAALPLRHETHLLPVEPLREETDGRVRWTWELGPQEAIESMVADAPGDVVTTRSVAWSTGRSWEEVAAAYARWVDERVDGAALPAEVTAAVAAASGRRAKVAAALAWLHREVRYVALALGDAAIVPRSPAETLDRQYGDCKDKSTLLVAVLRQAGIDAELALLTTGPGMDVDPDLPGFGLFDHAIVHLPADEATGEPELWIDATVPEARVGQLPAPDRGRQALLVRTAAGQLLRTPIAVSSANRQRVEREVTLSDWGPGREARLEIFSGDFEIFVRSIMPALRADAESGFAAAEVVEPPLDDPATPLIVRFPQGDEEAGGTDLEWAAYSEDVQQLLDELPLALLPAEDGTVEEERRFDLEVPTPYVRELVLRVVPPPGFVPSELPPPEERALGVARFERRVEEAADGSVRVTVRFDSGPGRLTPPEVAATRQALAELRLEDGLTVQFRSYGDVLLQEGRVREAVAELRRLAESEERASYRARLAHALLFAGLGEAARREARAAVALETDSVAAQQTLGYVLLHDLFGRQFQPGSDVPAGEEAFRRALELDPADATSLLNLAVLLEHGEDGHRYGRGARLDEAIERYRALREASGNAYDQNLLVALWRAGRFDEVAALAAEGSVAEATAFSVAAAAAVDGTATALRKAAASSSDAAVRRDQLTNASSHLVQARLYPLAAELTAASAQGAPDAAERLARLAVQRKLVRHETLEADPADPGWALFRLVRAVWQFDERELEAIMAEVRRVGGDDGETDGGDSSDAYSRMRRDLATNGLDVDVLLDAWNASVEVQSAGTAAAGYRTAMRSLFGGEVVWYLVPGAEGALVPVTNSEGPLSVPLGRQALRHLAAGRIEAARQWLDWARQEARVGSADDPWGADAVTLLWTQGAAGDEAAVRRAATSLVAGGEEAAEVVGQLEEWLEASEDEGERRGFALALAEAYRTLERWPDVARLARAWAEATPHSLSAFTTLTTALHHAGSLDLVVEAAERRLADLPNDPWALRALADAAARSGDLLASRQILERLVASPDAVAMDHNDLAWNLLVEGGDLEVALGHAYRAVQGGGGYAALHTLASVLAELERPLEAKDVMLQAMESGQSSEPRPDDWYVFGRIAESCDEREAARAAYERVEEPPTEQLRPRSTWLLAQRRLAGLGASAEGQAAR